MIDRYFSALGEAMARESRLMADVYRHPGKLGKSRESQLARFLEAYLTLPFRRRQWLRVVRLRPIDPAGRRRLRPARQPCSIPEDHSTIFPPSALHALIEVKSQLAKPALAQTARKACTQGSAP